MAQGAIENGGPTEEMAGEGPGTGGEAVRARATRGGTRKPNQTKPSTRETGNPVKTRKFTETQQQRAEFYATPDDAAESKPAANESAC